MSGTPGEIKLTVDVVVMTVVDDRLEVLLVRRRIDPFEGMWALPGGFVYVNETLEEATRRELRDETGVEVNWIEQLYTFGEVDRDPRRRVVTVVYFALVDSTRLRLQAGSDAAEAQWHAMDALPELAFDHRRIVDYALRRLRYKLEYAPVAFQLLPPAFTLSELRKVHEAILGVTLDKRNFRRKILSLGSVEETGELRAGAHRPAQLYRFKRDRFEELGGGVLFTFG